MTSIFVNRYLRYRLDYQPLFGIGARAQTRESGGSTVLIKPISSETALSTIFVFVTAKGTAFGMTHKVGE